MKIRLLKLLIASVLICSLLPLSSCTKEPELPPEQEQEKEEKITLTAANAKEYIGINLSFGELSKMSSETSEKERVSCIAYIEVFPTGEYQFESAKVALAIEQSFVGDYTLSRFSEWLPEEKKVTLTLDKNGYGSTRLYLYREYSKDAEDIYEPYMFPRRLRHPSEAGKWSTMAISASGTVIKVK